MIADEIIHEIRSKADIVAVIGQHVQLKKAGRSWKGLCPFHGEKTPSFNVMPDKGFFHCFGCQKSGDVFKFVMEIEGKTFIDAVEQLGARFGVEVPKIEESPDARRARGERVAMLDINKLATAFFREMLADPKRGEPGRAYLAKRGVGDATAAAFQLGYAPADWHALADYLKDKRADLELAAKLGLVAKQPSRGGYYDRNRDRLVCPVVVPGGDVVGFSARVIDKIGAGGPPPDDGKPDEGRARSTAEGSAQVNDPPPKYINSPESTVYKKSRLLFGLAQAREGMQKLSRAVLVEGNFDVITLHQAEFTEVIAPLGTALTPEQVQLLKRLVPTVVLLYDGDRAGYKATMHALETCVEAEIDVRVARRPGNGSDGGAGPLRDGADPDSFVAGGGAAKLRRAIDGALGGIEFFCAEVWGKSKSNADARARATEDLARMVARVETPVKREMYIDAFAKALDIAPGIVRAEVGRAHGRPAGSPGSGRPAEHHPNAPAGDAPAPSSGPRSVPIEEVEVLALLADHPSLIASSDADKAFWLLTDETLHAMYRRAREGVPFTELVAALPPQPAKLVLSGKYSDHKDPRGQLVAMIAGLERKKQRLEDAGLAKSLADARRGATNDRELERLQARLAQAQRRGDRALADELAAQISSNRKQAE